MSVIRRSRPTPVTEVPGYRLETPVGFGAGGAVWGARDAAGRPVAVSFVTLPPGERGTAALRRLGALRAAAHPHLPRVLDVVGLDPARCALVAEIVDGPTLATVRAARGDLPPEASATLLGALASALAHLHDHGVVHGDVAPTNVVLTAAGVPVLVDLAGEASHERGTPGFVAPERRSGSPASTAADVWALARVVSWAAGDRRGPGDPVGPSASGAPGGPGVAASPAAGPLTAALSPDPALRPSAQELARFAATMPAAAAIELPSGADLAQARLRSGQAATEVAPSRRPRGRHRRPRRLGRRRAALAVTALALVAGAVLPVLGATSAPPAPVTPAEASALVRDLVAARDEALRDGRTEVLAELTVPGSPAAAEDELLVERLRTAGVRAEGLSTTVDEVRLVSADGGPSPSAVVEAVLRQEGYRLVPADGSGEEGGQPVEARAPRCLRMALSGPAPWRLSEASTCGGSAG
ncbi:serine/threonine protein kinase [Georgenia soli]|uniref:non-specific serine/threonine protein kinase n=1 Tax=Georgenia soli TaxID=638953 RepID=A0A2A9ERH3_9MICO|nr:protein kinase [Georgenia soli]PFG41353.1 serine/threonine protein kinase [Georgenia soli]